MKSQRYTLMLTIVFLSLLTLPAFGQSRTKDFIKYNCRLTLPDQTWQWDDNLNIPNAIALAQSSKGFLMIFTAMRQGRNVPINDEFIKGFEGGAIQPGGRKIHGQKLTYNNVPCYQLVADQGISDMHSCTRVFYGDQTAYSVQFLIPKEVEVDAERLNYLYGSFTFITAPTLEYPNDVNASRAYRLGRMAGGITFWVLVIVICRKLGKIQIGKHRSK